MFYLKIFFIFCFLAGSIFSNVADRIYLLPMSTTDDERLVLREEIIKKARAQQAICGIDIITLDRGLDADLPCISLDICNLSASERHYVLFTNFILADTIAHLVYFYQRLLLIQAWEQYELLGPKGIGINPSYNIHGIWNGDLAIESLNTLGFNLLGSQKSMIAWNSIEKTGIMAKLADHLTTARLQFPSAPLQAIQKFHSLVAAEGLLTYSKSLVKQFVQELPGIVEGLSRKLLEEREAMNMPFDFQDQLFYVSDVMRKIKPVRVQSMADMHTIARQADALGYLFGDRLSAFFISESLQAAQKSARKKNLPLVMTVGYDLLLYVYEFLKNNDIEVVVGMPENILNLDDVYAATARSLSLKSIMQEQMAMNIKMSIGIDLPDHVVDILKRFKNSDPQALEAYEYLTNDIEGDRHDEL